jgi:hypothetical protein
MASMSVDSEGLWDAFVDAMFATGHVQEGRSRYGHKPALSAGSREIAHLESTERSTSRSREPDGHRPGRTSSPILPYCMTPDDGTGSSCAPSAHPTLTGSPRSWPLPRQPARDHHPIQPAIGRHPYRWPKEPTTISPKPRSPITSGLTIVSAVRVPAHRFIDGHGSTVFGYWVIRFGVQLCAEHVPNTRVDVGS